MKFKNVKANEVIAKFYFDNHPDIKKDYNPEDYDFVNALFFDSFDALVRFSYRKIYPSMTQEQIECFIDTVIYK